MNLIQPNGQPQWGRFDALPSDINWRDYDARTALGHPRSVWVKPWLMKHFDFYGLTAPNFTLGVGLVRLGLVNSAFAYWAQDGVLRERVQFDLPMDAGLTVDYRPLGTTRWRHPWRSNHHITSHRQANLRRLEFRLGSYLNGEVELRCNDDEALSMNTPIGNTGFAYAQKTSGCPVQGYIQCGGTTLELPEHTGCYHDWTAGFLRRETFWNWACATGMDHRTRTRLSVNLARGVNETSAHENVVWVNGRRHDLPLTLFDYDRDNVMAPWRVYSQCGQVDLYFKPTGQIDDHRNLGLLASRFNQCHGEFSGTLSVPGLGQTFHAQSFTGWCEDHYAKW
ncbi:DUF2804 domain-containing protein [Limnobacter humi]|uniref:DUF2804 domain-containing protein n=1 Tax=Limnobacter humi TaxID=1778671 RepID=A0ABT1WHB4_9BURK|nr:DUF2804 domain-containing protein [Limnobacter humi]MCQ8896107.1 DUF2804 domain-containing protein [Limnobacter humi]